MLRDSSGTLVAVRACCGLALKCWQISDPQRGQNRFPLLGVKDDSYKCDVGPHTGWGEIPVTSLRGEEKATETPQPQAPLSCTSATRRALRGLPLWEAVVRRRLGEILFPEVSHEPEKIELFMGEHQTLSELEIW